MTGTGWRGSGPYSGIVPGDGDAGGGAAYSREGNGQVDVLAPGSSGGGGLAQSTAAPLAGYGGVGGPGPGALIGL